ncbi:MAG TPA: nitroreductase/quinone reductase family protein [Streptosporangiaceae bacterium]|nr:nitroreductase/quinone reductase family protein [Streptosporangiaceae bacterium]
MATPATRPRRNRIQQRVFKVVNVPMRTVLGLPFATPLGKRLMLVFFTGRRTGRSYRQPLSYVKEEGVLLTPGGGNWKFNLADGKPVRIRLRGRDLQARPELVRDPGEVQRLLGIMVAANPMIGRFIPIPRDPDGRFDQQRLDAALTYGFRIVRWHLDSD